MSFDILQLQSLATAELGNAIATYTLGKNGSAAVQGLQDLATDLPLIPLGKVTASELGALSAELNATQASMKVSATAGVTTIPTAPPSNLSQIISQLGSLIALITTSQPSASGGLETVDQAIAVQYFANVSQGLLNGVQFWQGSQGGGKATP
jgi:hypothetical protein